MSVSASITGITSDTGTSGSDYVTSDTTLTFKGSWSSDQPTGIVYLFIDGALVDYLTLSDSNYSSQLQVISSPTSTTYGGTWTSNNILSQGTHTVTLRTSSSATGGSQLASRTVIVDTTAPTISSEAISGATGILNSTLNAGDVVTASVTMSETVYVTGAPTLALNIGGTTVAASYASGSGSNVLTFTYTILAGQTDTNGISIGSNALVLNSGTIQDKAGNAATITGTAVSDNSSYKVDTTAATISSEAVSAATGLQNSTLNSGDVVTAAVTFSEAVLVTGSPNLSLIIGGSTVAASYASGSGSSTLLFTYTILSGQTDTNGISLPSNAFVLNSGTITDLAGNTATITAASVSDNAGYLVDTTAPSSLASRTLDLADASDAGGSSTDNITNVTTPTITVSSLNGVTLAAGEIIQIVDTSNGSAIVGSYTIAANDVNSGVWNGTTKSIVLSSALSSGTHALAVRLSDAAGNIGTQSTSTLPVTVDVSAPTVSALSLTGASGLQNSTLNTGDTVTATVTLSEAVVVTGSPQLALDIGGTTIQAGYASGSGSNKLAFTYTVQSGQTDSNGIAIGTSALSLNSGSITDVAGNSLTLSNTVVADNASYKVDTTRPTISAVALTGATGALNNTLNAGDVVTATVTMSEAVTVDTSTGTPTLGLIVGTSTVQATYASGSGSNLLAFTYTILAGQTDSNGISIAADALSLNAATITDLAGNAMTTLSNAAVGDNSTYKVDTTSPTVVSEQITGANNVQNSTANAGDVVTVAVSFSEAVTVASAPSLNLDVGGTTVPASYISGSGSKTLYFSYTILGGQTDADGIGIPANALVAASGALVDSAGNAAVLSFGSVVADANYKVDTTAPTVTAEAITAASGIQNDRLNAGDVVTVAVSLSEAVTVSGTPQLALNIGSVTAQASYASGSGSSTLLFTYTIQAGQTDTNGISLPLNALGLNNGTITDAAGNAATLTANAVGDNGVYKVDTTAPAALTQTLSLPGSSTNETSDTTPLVRVSSLAGLPAEAGDVIQIVDTSTGNLIVGSYTIAAGDLTSGIWNGTTADITLSALSSGAHTLGLRHVDAAGNAGALGASTLTVTIDTTAPSITGVAIDSATDSQNSRLNAGDVVTLSVTMSKTVVVTGTPLLALDVGGVEAQASYVSGSGSSILQFVYTVVSGLDDTDGIAIPAGALSVTGASIQSTAGVDALLTSAAVGSNSAYLVDTTAPTVIAVACDTTGTVGADGFVVLSVTFSEAVLVTGSPTLSLNTGGTAVYAGRSDDYTLTFHYIAASGENTDDLALGDPAVALPDGAAITDRAGNDADLTGANGANPAGVLAVDTTAPTVSGIAISGSSDKQNNTLVAGDTVTVSVSMSEVVTVSGSPQLTLNIGDAQVQASYLSGSDTDTLLFTYTIVSGDNESQGISIPDNALILDGPITDLAGNSISPGSSYVSPDAGYMVDTALPTITSVAVIGDIGLQNSRLNAGDLAYVKLITSEDVVLTGTPTLTIEIGATLVDASFAGFGNANELYFSYQILPGQNDSNGISIPPDALALHGGSLKDAAGNAAVVTSAAVDNDPLYLVDTTAPNIVAVTYGTNTGLLGLGGIVEILVTFDEDANVYGSPTLTLNSGGTAVYETPADGLTKVFKYIVGAGENVSDLAVISYNQPDATTYIDDLAGNVGSPSGAAGVNPEGILVVDSTTPTIVSASVFHATGAENGRLNEGDQVTVSLTMSENVTFFGGLGIKLDLGGSLIEAIYADGDGTDTLTFAYTIQAGDSAPEGIGIWADPVQGYGGGTITDLAGNFADLTFAGVANNAGYIVDTTPPSVVSTSFGSTDGDLALGETIQILVRFNEDLQVSGTPVLTLNNGGTATYTGAVGDALVFQYAPAAGEDVGALQPTELTLPDGVTITDLAGNAFAETSVTLPAPTGTVAVDTVAPTLDAVTDGTGSPNITQGQTVSLQLTFSEPVHAEDGASITLSNGDSAFYVSGSGTNSLTFGVTASVTASGVTVSGAAGVTDLAGNAVTGFGDTICFMAGTLIRTPSGEVPVETLRPGDLVLTTDGEARPVRWLGRQTVSTVFADPLRVLPIRIKAGALGEALPLRDLLVSPDHALLVGGVLVHAGALVNGLTVVREQDVPQSFVYYHVELPDHALILAEGVAAETFIDNVDRMAFDNWAEHELACAADAPLVEMGLPRAKSYRQVPRAVRQLLASRAEALCPASAQAA
ncbi:MAG: Hint domain-containing protein [Acetobacteraceae bacterium]